MMMSLGGLVSNASFIVSGEIVFVLGLVGVYEPDVMWLWLLDSYWGLAADKRL